MGHINLVVPVAHIWYFRSLPNKIGYLLGLPTKKLDMIIYYERYVVINAGAAETETLKYLEFLTEEEYLNVLDSLPKENQFLDEKDPNKFIAKMGAEAIHELLNRLDLDEMSYRLRHQANTETSQQRKTEALKRLQVVESFRQANTRFENRPEWMIVRVVPVIPPELRPLVPLDGGRFATSDLNDLYRRVIIRNNRLKRLLEIKAPEVILRNEKRMLQESVDSLLDNSRKSNAVKTESNRALKSLSDSLKGKQIPFFYSEFLDMNDKKVDNINDKEIVNYFRTLKQDLKYAYDVYTILQSYEDFIDTLDRPADENKKNYYQDIKK
jgi:DNA-directed RNA polymerase subunit beta'